MTEPLTPFRLSGQWCMHITTFERDILCHQVTRQTTQEGSCQSFCQFGMLQRLVSDPAEGTPQSAVKPGCLLHERMAECAAIWGGRRAASP